MAEPTLRDLRAALMIAETRNLRQAAKRLDVAPSTLSQALATLEQSLGVRLFHRTTRSVAVTAQGRSLLDQAAPLVARFDDLLAMAGAEAAVPQGRLRLNTPHSAGVYLLQYVVPVFARRYPGVQLELQHEERMVDIVAAGSDAGIRRRHTVAPDMIGVPFGQPLRWIPVASPAYLAEAGIPAHPRDLMAHRCIRIRLPGGEHYRWEFDRDGEELTIDVPGGLTLDRMSFMVEAALQGLGIAYVLDHLVDREVAEGRLRPLLRDWCSDDAEYMLYYPRGRAPMPALRAFADVLRAATSRRERPASPPDPDGPGERSGGALSREDPSPTGSRPAVTEPCSRRPR